MPFRQPAYHRCQSGKINLEYDSIAVILAKMVAALMECLLAGRQELPEK
jgi:hypothetical protein